MKFYASNNTITEQMRKTEQVISQVVGKPRPNAAQSIQQTETTVESTQFDDEIAKHAASLIMGLKEQVVQDVLAKLLPLIEAMEKAARSEISQLKSTSSQQSTESKNQQNTKETTNCGAPSLSQLPTLSNTQQNVAAYVQQQTLERKNKLEQQHQHIQEMENKIRERINRFGGVDTNLK